MNVDDDADPAPPVRKLRMSRVISGVVVGALVAAALLMVAILAIRRSAVPRLTREAFAAAEQRWDEHGPQCYDLDLTLTGNRPGEIHVEVRHGKVTAMQRDGVQPKQQRTWVYWSVPGLFDTIEQEFDFPGAAGAEVIQRAAFDEHFGYPRQYERSVMGKPMEIGWRVTSFKPCD